MPRGDPRGVPRVRFAMTVATPMVIGALLAALVVMNQHQRGRLQADAAVRASVASAATKVDSTIRDQLSAAVGPAPAGRTVPAAGVLGSPELVVGAGQA